MRNGEGFLLVFSVIDRSRFVNAEYCSLFSVKCKPYRCASFLIFSFCSFLLDNTDDFRYILCGSITYTD